MSVTIALAIACILQALGLAVLIVAIVWNEKRHAREIKALLDRLMSRNYTDYVSSKRVETSAPRRRSMTDAEEAQIEQKKRQGAAAAHV